MRDEMETLTREQTAIFPRFSEISRHRRYQHLISRAANMRLLSRTLALAVLVAGAMLPSAADAQVVPAIKGGGSQINVYGTYTAVKTDFNSTLDYPPQHPSPDNTFDANGWNQGFSVGADFRLGRFVFGQPAVGTRFTYSDGTYGKQRTFMFGPELHYIYKRFRPYGDFMIGPGNITYRTGQTDNSIVYELGGGVDYHKNPRLNFRLVDFQYQFWDLGNHYYPPGFLPGQPGVYIDTKLKPYTLSFGVLIRVR
jgi:opacity protein-like surface antigen